MNCTCGALDCPFCGPAQNLHEVVWDDALTRAARDLVGIYNRLPPNITDNLPAVLVMAIKHLDEAAG